MSPDRENSAVSRNRSCSNEVYISIFHVVPPTNPLPLRSRFTHQVPAKASASDVLTKKVVLLVSLRCHSTLQGRSCVEHPKVDIRRVPC